MSGLTLFDKVWNNHVVRELPDDRVLLYIDRHLLHEVTSPQAFEGLKINHRSLWRRDVNIAVPDHNIPTTSHTRIDDEIAKCQIETLDKNCKDLGILEFTIRDPRQGIVHIIGPEQGLTLPGMTIVCGDSHTSTHGAFASIAMGIGTSEVEHVLATGCLVQKKLKNFLIEVNGKLSSGVYAKDIILAIIRELGTAGGSGYAIEYSGDTISQLSMEARMTICNMSIEAGAKCGLIAVDQTTLQYIQNKPFAPAGAEFEKAKSYWQTLTSDRDATFDKKVSFDASKIKPQLTWGTAPNMVISIDEKIPNPLDEKDISVRQHMQSALDYMGLKPNLAPEDIPLDRVFIGSCTNSRIEDLRAAANIVKNHKVAKNLKQALVVPGSGLVKKQAEAEGLHEIFLNAGFEWRLPGCSMCLAMNPDKLLPKEHCASTSNRNFEGRQGKGGRTHLVSPVMAAAAAIAGHFIDVRKL